MSKLVFASVISEIKQSDVFMTVKARICEAPEANLNGARVTEGFIDEIVGNESRYVGLPLYADKKALISGNYTRLGHLYDVKTGEFHSTQIGSFYKFEKETTENGCALVGYARIPKRNKKLSKAIIALFGEGNLKFSFELSVGEYEELDDDTILIDASENNYLEGTAIVSYPACEDAVALELVAQQADVTRKGESEMAEVETKAEVVETEAEQLNAEEEISEEKIEEVSKEASEEEAECKKKEKAEEETAAVVTHEYHEERHTSVAYDTETGKEVSQTVTIETCSNDIQEGTLVESVDGLHVAEKKGDESDTLPPIEEEQSNIPVSDVPDLNGGNPILFEKKSDESDTLPPSEEEEEEGGSTPTDAPSGTKGAPSEEEPENPEKPVNASVEQIVAKMAETIESLKAEIAALKEKKQVTAEINPFMESISAQGKYSLLEKEAPKQKYSLLD